MTEYHNAGNSEADQKQGLAALLAQSSPGIATTGVLKGLQVTQTQTASGSVQVGQGAGVVQASLTAGASLLFDPAPTLDVFTAHPVGSLPRNDIVVFDATTGEVAVLVGAPNASPTDPTVPASALRLARLRHAANATGIPNAKIDDLRVFTSLLQPEGSDWTDFAPKGYSLVNGNEVQVAATAGLCRMRMVNAHTVQAYAAVTFTNATSGGARVALPIPAKDRVLDCGTAGVFGPGAPTDQSGVAYMVDGNDKLVCVAFSTGYRDAAAGNTFRYAVTYEI